MGCGSSWWLRDLECRGGQAGSAKGDDVCPGNVVGVHRDGLSPRTTPASQTEGTVRQDVSMGILQLTFGRAGMGADMDVHHHPRWVARQQPQLADAMVRSVEKRNFTD